MTDDKSFLIVRTDRVGDVLLTTPLGALLKKQFPACRVGWLVRPYTAPLLEGNTSVDYVLLDRDQPTGALGREIRAAGVNTALVVYPRWRTTYALWRAGVRERIGPANKWYSVLFSRRVWQKRSRSERHEADYNLELVTALGVPARVESLVYEVNAAEERWAKDTWRAYRLEGRPCVILHPGSGGSAPRWPLTHFMRLGDRLAEAGVQVVVTAGAGETYQNVMLDQMRHPPVMIAAGTLTLRQLAALFKEADLVVSNSTGPLHLAVAVQTPTVSVYPGTAACHPKRWGPYPDFVVGGERHQVLVAEAGGGGVVDMATVSVDHVYERCQAQLSAARAGSATARND